MITGLIIYFIEYTKLSYRLSLLIKLLILRQSLCFLFCLFLVDKEHIFGILGRKILVAPAPQLVRSIASATHTPLDGVGSHCLKIICPTDLGEKVDEGCGQVQRVVTPLGSLVIPGEDVVIVVPALTEGEQRDIRTLRRVDVPEKRIEG